jgi:hypothetical protein
MVVAASAGDRAGREKRGLWGLEAAAVAEVGLGPSVAGFAAAGCPNGEGASLDFAKCTGTCRGALEDRACLGPSTAEACAWASALLGPSEVTVVAVV